MDDPKMIERELEKLRGVHLRTKAQFDEIKQRRSNMREMRDLQDDIAQMRRFIVSAGETPVE